MKKKKIIAAVIIVAAIAIGAIYGGLYYNGYLDMNEFEYDPDLYKIEGEWIYSVYDDTAEINSCRRVAGTVLDIPETLGGYPVVSLGWSFINDKQAARITQINVPDTLVYFRDKNFITTRWYEKQPDGVIYLGHIAMGFKGEVFEEKLIIKEGTRVIAGSSFSGEDSLVEVVFPSTLEIICSDAFIACDNLKKINIPDSIKEINNSAFERCVELETIETDNTDAKISRYAFWGTKWEEQQNEDLVSLCGTLLAYTKEGDGQDVFIGDSVKRISEFVFETHENMGIIHIPAGCTEISEWAFQDSSCKGFYVDENNLSYCSDDKGNLFSKDKTKLIRYAALNEDKVYTVPDYVTYIADEAFSNAKSLEEVVIHGKVAHIGSDAFYKTTALRSISVSEDNSIFRSIDGVLFDKEGTRLICYTNGSDMRSYTIPDGVTEVYDWAFAYCEDIEEIVIPDSVERVGSILGCKNLNCSGLITDREEFASEIFLQNCGVDYIEE